MTEQDMRLHLGLLMGLIALYNTGAGLVDAATITTPPSNVSALVGTQATFQCTVTGSQEFGERLQWRRVTPSPPKILSVDGQSSNVTKYRVAGKYALTVLDLLPEDQGLYQCVMAHHAFEASLVVSVPPENVTLYWDDRRDWARPGVPVNLTCHARNSRPPATFRWYKGALDITRYAYDPIPHTDNHGYGDAYSYQTMMLSKVDEGTIYRCIADLPGASNIRTTAIRVRLSNGGTSLGNNGVLLGVTTILMALLHTH